MHQSVQSQNSQTIEYTNDQMNGHSFACEPDFTARVMEDCSMDDFDTAQIHRLRKAIEQNFGEPHLLGLEDERLLQELGLIQSVKGQLLPVYAGILLLGKEEVIQEKLPTVGYAFQVWHNGVLKHSKRYSGGLIQAIESLEQDINPYNPEDERMKGLGRIACKKYSPLALREGLVNAVSHRNYAQKGDVRITIDEEGLTLSSPGPFMDGISADQLMKAEPRSRNPLLTNVLKRIGLSERSARGIDRMYQETIKMGLPWPDYSDSDADDVRLYFPDIQRDAGFVLEMQRQQEIIGDTLSAKMLMIFSILWNCRSTTDLDLSRRLNMIVSRVRQTVLRMEKGGSIHIDKSNFERWILSMDHPDQAQPVPTAEETTPKSNPNQTSHDAILQYVHTHGSIAMREVGQLLNINKGKASKMITELLVTNVLEKRGNGSATRYILKQ